MNKRSFDKASISGDENTYATNCKSHACKARLPLIIIGNH